MNFAERAFRYLFRKKGKAIILFWVLLITETMILSTVTILRASEVARIELLGKSKAKLLIEREKAEELFTDDEYKKLEKLENVKAVNRVAEVQLYPMDFKIITKSESVDADNQKLRIMAYDTPPRPVEEGKLVYLKLSEVHPFHTFRPHPFKVRDDAKMQEIVASIRVNGVMVPGLARPEKDGNGYEIVAGHRRTHGSELAGLEEMPFIVREMTDHEAVQAMKDSNKQRDGMLPSELAALLELEVEDIKHQGGRLKGVAEGDVGKRSVEIVGEAHEMNYKKVMRYLRLNSLVPELLDKVDDKKMGFMPAVELSYIKPKNQRLIAVSIDGEQASPSLAQAKRLRELDKEGKLNGDVIDGILSEQKKEDRGVIISTAELEKYFGKEVTPAKMKEQIMSLLDDWKEKQPPELAKAPKKQELDK